MRPGDIQKMMQMQKKLQDAQEEIGRTEYVGKATGVNVFILGVRQLVDIQIQPEMFEDRDMLRDAIVIAVNSGLKQIEDAHQKAVTDITGGMIPGGKLPF